MKDSSKEMIIKDMIEKGKLLRSEMNDLKVCKLYNTSNYLAVFCGCWQKKMSELEETIIKRALIIPNLIHSSVVCCTPSL